MSGAKLEVVRGERRPKAKLVRLDSREAPQNAGSEGFIIKSDGKDLVIAGGRPRGTMYGVYTLLDHLGVRWYTKEVTKVPKLATVKITKNSYGSCRSPLSSIASRSSSRRGTRIGRRETGLMGIPKTG